MKKLLLSLTLLLFLFSASAHAVFIETALKGEQGKSHVVKVVYGEPDEHETIAQWWWYKEGMQVSLTLTKPDGTTESLRTTAQSHHLLATFVPDQEGVYHISLQKDTERKPTAKIQYQINALATIQVGKSTLGNKTAHIRNDLFVFADQTTYRNKKEISLTLYQKGEPAPNSFCQIIAPSGWIRWVETDAQGVAKFTPEWQGKYYVEVSKKEKAEGQDFEEHSRATTMSFEVK